MNEKQPSPRGSEQPACWDVFFDRWGNLCTPELARDIRERDQMGERKYGTRLRPFNGRDAFIDLYQELLDAIVYTTQCICEEACEDDGQMEQVLVQLVSMAALVRAKRSLALADRCRNTPAVSVRRPGHDPWSWLRTERKEEKDESEK
jgi:hypothetical protein